MELSIGLALIAGLVSFVSPCVLPLVPAYIGYMGGRLTHTVSAQANVGGAAVAAPTAQSRFLTFLHGIAFVAGFTFIFVVLGLLTTAFIFQIGRQNVSLVTNLIGRVGGVLIIFFGLHYMGVLPSLFRRLLDRPSLTGNLLFSLIVAVAGAALILWAFVDILLGLPVLAIFLLWLLLGGAFTTPQKFWIATITAIQRALYSEVRLQMTARGEQSFATSAVMGVVFAAGWTPCIGPVYGAVLTMAANGGDVGQASVLLFAYSFGLGIPFLLTALLMDSAQGVLRSLRRHMHTIELAAGAFLVFIGVMVASGQLQAISQNFAGQFADISIRVEECAIGVAQGEIPLGQLGNCLNSGPDELPAPLAQLPPTAEYVEQPMENSRLARNLPSIEGIGTGSTGPTYGTEVGHLALNFDFQTDTGETMMLSDLRGQVVLLNFWATWCGPCRVEMPEFERAYLENRDDGFTVLAVNNRESHSDVVDFRREIGVTFPMALDQPGEIQNLYGVRSYPSTFLIDRDGVILARYVGPLSPAQVEQLVSSTVS